MSGKMWLKAVLLIAAGAALAGCLPEEKSSANQPAPNPGQSNSAPSIAGSPNTSAAAGTTYLFQPSAFDNDGDTLTFSATGLPAWASINPQSGLVSGTPGASHVGPTGSIVVRVSDGEDTSSLPAFQITVAAAGTPPPPNQSPTISGTPATSIAVGAPFSFTPAASDPEGGALAFSITSKPAWASFSTTTGQLSGTAQAGTYNIVITVTDPAAAAASLSFTLTVNAGNPAGTAALSWTKPGQNTDGSNLTDLAGYRIYHGLNASALNDVVEINGENSTSYTFNALASGTHYFAVSAFNNSGVESALSGVGSKAIP